MDNWDRSIVRKTVEGQPGQNNLGQNNRGRTAGTGQLSGLSGEISLDGSYGKVQPGQVSLDST